MGRLDPILAQFGFHTPFRCLVPQLQPHLLVKTVNPLRINMPALSAEQDVNAAIAITHSGFCNLFDTFLQIGLIIAAGPIVITGSLGHQHTTSTPDTDIPDGPKVIDQFTAASRP
jgi:hypothetical protein